MYLNISIQKVLNIRNIIKRDMATSLIISDLQNIDLTGLTYGQGTGCGSSNYVAFRFFDSSQSYGYGERKGVNKTGCSFMDGSGGESHPLMMDILAIAPADILAGDYVNITFDGGQTKDIYLPALSGTGNPLAKLYIANDGSTYYDQALTQLARSSTAPPSEGFATILSFTADKASAHAGDSITFLMSIRNDGDVTDGIFARIIDVDIGAIVMSDIFFMLAPGEVFGPYPRTVTMPNKTWNLRLEAGHQE